MPETGLRFTNLPLMEVVIRLRPVRPLPVDLTTLFNAATELRSDLPNLQHLEQVQPTVGPAAVELAFGNLIGAMFSDENAGLHLALQPNLLSLTWQNETLSNATSYPHYPALKALLTRSVHAIYNVIKDDDMAFNACNMSYTNYVKLAADPVGSDVGRYIGEEWVPAHFRGNTGLVEINQSWREPSGTEVRLYIRRVQQPGDSVARGMSIMTAAGTFFEDSLPFEKPLDHLHQLLQSTFVKLITPHAKREWGLQNA